MTRLTMLVTPDGRWVLPDSPEFFEALGDATPDYDAVAFAVRNLGFIKFEQIQRSIVEVELHPRTVDIPALLAVQQQILTAPVSLFRIKYLDASWRSEISSSAEHTVARLAELCAPVFNPMPTDRFLAETRDYSELFDNEENPMRILAQKWRMSFGHFDPHIIPLAMQNQLLAHMMIVGVKPREKEPRWRFIGHGQRWLGNSFQFGGVGEPVDNMPDKEYGAWVSQFFQSVASSSQPRYDVVRASMQYEDEAGRPRRTVRYERLLLPWKTPSEEVLVTSCINKLEGGAAAAAVSPNVTSFAPKKVARSS